MKLEIFSEVIKIIRKSPLTEHGWFPVWFIYWKPGRYRVAWMAKAQIIKYINCIYIFYLYIYLHLKIIT